MEKLYQTYNQLFGDRPTCHVFSPYMICPLGAHVDHQHGVVAGLAMNQGIDLLCSPTEDGQVAMASLNQTGITRFSLLSDALDKQMNWGDYLRAAVWAMRQTYPLKRGVRGVVRGSIPSGGIGSSAALLCGFITMLAKANHLPLKPAQVVRLASMAERQFVGLNNGILDHACVALSKKNHLLFLDTDTSEHQSVAFGSENGEPQEQLPFKIAIFYSGISRSLTITDYNLRVQECRTAASILQAYEDDDDNMNDNILRNTKKDIYERYVSVMPPRYARRARHFYSECQRVADGMTAWRQGDIQTFGRLMFESCESSIHNYECGSPELITIYRSLRRTEGVYGARFCGAGFIGSCFALIDPEREDDIRLRVVSDYVQQFPMYKDLVRTFVCESHGGVGFVEDIDQ